MKTDNDEPGWMTVATTTASGKFQQVPSQIKPNEFRLSFRTITSTSSIEFSLRETDPAREACLL